MKKMTLITFNKNEKSLWKRDLEIIYWTAFESAVKKVTDVSKNLSWKNYNKILFFFFFFKFQFVIRRLTLWVESKIAKQIFVMEKQQVTPFHVCIQLEKWLSILFCRPVKRQTFSYKRGVDNFVQIYLPGTYKCGL